MVFGEDDLRGHTLMSEFLTLVQPSNQPLHSAYRHHNKEKRREYQQRVHEVERWNGYNDATQFYKRLANLLSANTVFLTE